MSHILKQAEEGRGGWKKDLLMVFYGDLERYKRFVHKDDALGHMRKLRAATDPEVKRKLYEEMVAGNSRLVVSIAFKYLWGGRERGFEVMDLIQEGMFGLFTAIEKYDPERGYAFSTYASHWIRQAISRGLNNSVSARPMRIPVHFQEFMNSIEAVMREFLKKNAREAMPHEIYREVRESAKKAGKKPPTMKQVGSALRYIAISSTSMDQTLGTDKPKTMGDDGVTLGSMLSSHIPIPDKVLEAKEQLEAFNAVIEAAERWVAVQPPRTQEIVSLRLGLFGKQVLVLDEIGHRFGISRERVRQIDNRAVAELEDAVGFSREELRFIISSVERLEVYIMSAM